MTMRTISVWLHCAARTRRPRSAHLPRQIALLACAATALIAPRALGQVEQPAGIADLGVLERAFQEVIVQVSPSVVGIRVQRQLPIADEVTSSAAHVTVNGSGTVLSADGLILTSEHVIQDASEIEVLFFDGQRLPALVLAADPRSDLAVLLTARADLHPAVLCDWDRVARGQWIVVLGNPFGLGRDGQASVSVGVIANLRRQLPGLGEADDRFYRDMLQITAPINPGNSGGPLFNIRGELVGVVAAMHTRSPADDGVGFAIPLSPAKRRLIELLSAGRTIDYGYLGTLVRVPGAAERAALGVGYGVVVQRVEADGPAAQAGIVAGDVLLELDGQPVTGPGQLAEVVGQTPAGSVVQLALRRGGEVLSLHATLARRDGSRVSVLRDAGP
jgi:S1-C subfamily serine protease